MGEPFCASEHVVEAVAMHHEKAFAVSRFVNRLVRDLDTGHRPVAKIPKRFAVIPWDINDARSRIDLGEIPDGLLRRNNIPHCQLLARRKQKNRQKVCKVAER
jgi:hypothetical protein